MVKKQYLKTKAKCKVTFEIPPKTIKAETVYLVGDFNNWEENVTPLKKMKDGRFSVTLELEPGREYQFRYLVDGSQWHNDWQADKYVPNPFIGDNSVITT